MKKWSALALGLLVGAVVGRTVRVESAHACEPDCAPDQSVVLEVTQVEGGADAKKFWVEEGARDAVVTPHYLLFAVGDGQIEVGYGK